MTSGHHLTQEQVDEILRLAGLQREGGEWLLTYQRIAEELNIDHRTVSECVRRAAAAYGILTRWHA